jgi:lactoylglutathione lyase
MKYLHTMVRVTDVDASLKFYCDALGLEVLKRNDYPQGKFSLIFPPVPAASSDDHSPLPLSRGHAMTKYLHTMIRVSSLEDTIAFFEVLGLREIRRRPDEKGRYTNVFLAAPGDEAAAVELTYNWDPEPYTGGRNFGHLAYAVDNIYNTCNAFMARGVTINRPPRDGRMAFIRTPDGISIELLQAGEALPPAEPWTSMRNTGSW